MATPWIDFIAPLSAAAAVVLPPLGFATNYIIKHAVASQVDPIKNQLDLHTLSDGLMFKGIDEKLVDLKNGQNNQTEKLDSLVEHLL